MLFLGESSHVFLILDNPIKASLFGVFQIFYIFRAKKQCRNFAKKRLFVSQLSGAESAESVRILVTDALKLAVDCAAVLDTD